MDSHEVQRRLGELFPPLGVRVITPRLVLQMPSDEDLLSLLAVIADGIHDPDVMPFSLPWTDTPTPQRDRESLSFWWRTRATWSPTDWMWAAAIYVDGAPIGVQSMQAVDFATRRQVSSGSWLGQRFQGQGLGTEARAAVLHLAFEGLGAVAAHSGYVGDNAASRRVSEQSGYAPNGYVYEHVRDTLIKVSNVVLERSEWERRRRDDIVIEGLEPCRELFGAA